MYRLIIYNGDRLVRYVETDSVEEFNFWTESESAPITDQNLYIGALHVDRQIYSSIQGMQGVENDVAEKL